MNVRKIIDYSNFSDEVEKMLTTNIFNTNQDSVDNYEHVSDQNEDAPYDNDKGEENMGYVISNDDDVGDQDYNMIAVDDD